MSTAFGAPCPKCQKAPLLRFTTDGNGRHKETLIEGCEHIAAAAAAALAKERRKLRLCRDCGVSIADRVWQASLCEPCSAASHLRREAESRERTRELRRERDRERAKRRYYSDPEREREEAREYRAQNKERLRQEWKKKRLRNAPVYQRKKEKDAEYRRKNRKRLNARARARYWANRDRILAERAEEKAFKQRQAEARERLAAQTAPPEKRSSERRAA